VIRDQEWLTLGQAARFLGVAESTIRRWADDGRVRAFYTPGRHRRFRLADLQELVEGSGPRARPDTR
jgi:excisionase family DNA binding protein